MKTQEQAPWLEYIEINEETGERELKKDTPEEIKKEYEKYLKEIEKLNKKNVPMSK